MKEFKKSDLTETMVCLTKNGLPFTLKELKQLNAFGVSRWNEDLTSLLVQYNITTIYDLKDVQPIWQREEPIVLNEKEKAILVAYSDHKWIGRDKDNDLCLFISKPEKLLTVWYKSLDSEKIYEIQSYLFPFVKWEDEEPTSLDELRGLK